MTASAPEIWMDVLTHAELVRNPAKKWRRCEAAELAFAELSEGQARGFILPNALEASSRGISLLRASGSVNCLRVNFLRKRAFLPTEGLVVRGSLKIFREGFPAALR